MHAAEGLIELTNSKKGDILVLHLTGRLDAVSSPNAEKKVFEFIDQGERKLLFDFSGVSYLSSAGMRMLLATLKRLKNPESKLVLCQVTPNVMDVLKMSGFDHVLEVAASEEEGLSRF